MPIFDRIILTTVSMLLAWGAVLAVAAETRVPSADEFMEQVRQYNESGRFRDGSPPRRTISPAARAVEQFQRAVAIHARKGATPAELKEAAALYQAAADAGLPQASTNLAMLYLEGKGVKKDAKKAIALLNGASKKGVPEADMLLARLYLTGRDVKRDDRKGEWHLNRAAKTGNRDAVRMLAEYGEWKRKNELAMKEYREMLKKAREDAGRPGAVSQLPVPQPAAGLSPGPFPVIPGQSYLGLSRPAMPAQTQFPHRPLPAGLFPAMAGQSYLGLDRAATPSLPLVPARPAAATAEKTDTRETTASPRPPETRIAGEAGKETPSEQLKPTPAKDR